jgi:hypothetical protein
MRDALRTSARCTLAFIAYCEYALAPTASSRSIIVLASPRRWTRFARSPSAPPLP